MFRKYQEKQIISENDCFGDGFNQRVMKTKSKLMIAKIFDSKIRWKRLIEIQKKTKK